MGHTLLRYGVVFLATLATIIGRPDGGRDLRPSDHGLAFQEDLSSPPPDARSFFGGSSSAELPEAKNISDTAWWRSGRVRDSGRDHVRVGLLVASGVCGLTGVVLIVVSGVVFIFRAQKQKMEAKAADGIGSTSAPITGDARSDAVDGK